MALVSAVGIFPFQPCNLQAGLPLRKSRSYTKTKPATSILRQPQIIARIRPLTLSTLTSAWMDICLVAGSVGVRIQGLGLNERHLLADETFVAQGVRVPRRGCEHIWPHMWAGLHTAVA